MERKKLSVDNENPLSEFVLKSRKEKIDVELIKDIASKQGFTEREIKPTKKKNPFNEQFNTRVRDGVNELIKEVLFVTKLKKQDLVEKSLILYLEQNGLHKYLEEYNSIISDHFS